MPAKPEPWQARAARWLWYVNIVMAYAAVVSFGLLCTMSSDL